MSWRSCFFAHVTNLAAYSDLESPPIVSRAKNTVPNLPLVGGKEEKEEDNLVYYAILRSRI